MMTYADIEVPARNGGRFLRLSRSEAARLLQKGVASVQEVDRARRLLVLTDPSNRIITIIKGDPEQRAIDFRRVRGTR